MTPDQVERMQVHLLDPPPRTLSPESSVDLARASYELLHAVGEQASIEHRDVDQDLLPAGLHNRVRHTDPALVVRDGGRGGSLRTDTPHQHSPHLLHTTPPSPPRPSLRPGA
ncbi:hypothetical protein [Streptomyces sp. 039-1]|uniref:hypothetical protein n=1 Tax=Streptomyces sp. 039-1 TaxID=2789263 RepID=UPI0039F48ED5